MLDSHFVFVGICFHRFFLIMSRFPCCLHNEHTEGWHICLAFAALWAKVFALVIAVGCWILFLSAFLPNAAYTVQSTVFSFQNVANTVLIGSTCRFYLQNAANTVYIGDVSVKCDNNTLPGHIYCNYSANERLKVQKVANICKCHPRYAF